MLSNQLVLATLGAACITAAGAGGYLATRHGAVVVTPEAAVLNANPTPAAPADMNTAERVVGDAPATVALPQAATVQPIQAAKTVASSRPETRPERPAQATTHRSEPPVQNQPLPSRAVPTTASETAPAHAELPVFQPPPSVAEAEAPSGWDPAIADEPPATLQELVVAADSVIGIQMESTISSERSKVEDRVEARVVRDVRVGDERAIPAGSRTIGSVTAVERGGKFKERARLGIRFHTLVLADGTELPITTETIYRYGEAPGKSSATKVGGGAAAGAILGAILGGSKGAAVGAASGAGAGAAVVVAGDRSEATFTSGTELTARILAPVTVTVEK